MDAPVTVSLIAAVARNGVIGCRDEIPWHLPNDLKRFAALTKGHTVVAGRKTHESILRRLGHPLGKRETLILSQCQEYTSRDCRVVHSRDEALEYASVRRVQELFVIGGAEIYALFLPTATKLYLTRVHTACDGDAYFPLVDWSQWRIQSRDPRQRDAHHQHDYTFLNLERRMR